MPGAHVLIGFQSRYCSRQYFSGYFCTPRSWPSLFIFFRLVSYVRSTANVRGHFAPLSVISEHVCMVPLLWRFLHLSAPWWHLAIFFFSRRSALVRPSERVPFFCRSVTYTLFTRCQCGLFSLEYSTMNIRMRTEWHAGWGSSRIIIVHIVIVGCWPSLQRGHKTRWNSNFPK